MWGLLGTFRVILDHFGPFWSDFRAQSKRLGPVWSLFLTCLATQNDLNGPKSGSMGQDNAIMYWWGSLGAFMGHFGLFRSDFGPQCKRLGPISHPFVYPKWPLRVSTSAVQYSTRFVAIKVILGSQMGEKEAPNRPKPLALEPKITPKWPKMAAKGPQRPPKAPTSTVWYYPAPMNQIWDHSSHFE